MATIPLLKRIETKRAGRGHDTSTGSGRYDGGRKRRRRPSIAAAQVKQAPRELSYTELRDWSVEMPSAFDNFVIYVDDRWLAYVNGRTWGFFEDFDEAASFIDRVNDPYWPISQN